MTKIAVGATIGESIRVVSGNFGSLIAFSWLPFILYFLLSEPLDRFFYSSEEFRAWWSFLAAGLGEMSLAVILVPVYLAWHRLTLGLNTARGGLGLAIIRQRDGRYVVFTLLLYAPFVLIFWTIWAAAQFGDDEGMTTTNLLIVCIILASLAVWIWFVMRMSFLFVEIAIGAYDRFSKPWNATRGHAPRLLTIGIAASLPIIVVELFVIALGISEGPASRIALAVQCLAAFLTGVLWVSATSIAYRDITSWANKDIADVFG